MNTHRAVSAYKEALFENASPLGVVQMMYGGALRFLRQAKEVGGDRDRGRFNERVHRADAIVCELRHSLDRERAPELVANLSSLYLFAEERMRTAVLQHDTRPLDEAIEVLEKLLDGWKAVDGGVAAP